MAQPNNTWSSYDGIGVKEDISDIITMITPMDFPLTTMTGEAGKVTQRLYQWQTRELPAADDTNAVIEGDDVAADAATATVLLTQNTQISDRAITVSDSNQETEYHGREEDELADQMALSSHILKRDIEAVLVRNQGRVAGNDTIARKTRSIESWIVTNVDRGAGGANGTDTTAATDGTQRALTEDLLKTVIRKCYTEGGNPSIIMVGPFNKQKISSWTGGATKTVDAKGETLYAGIDMYKSDFGELKVVPNRIQRDRTAFVLEPEKWRVDFLQPYYKKKLGPTGHSEKWMIAAEYGLRSWNEKASGVIADLTTS